MFTLGLMNIHQLISIPRTNLTWVCSHNITSLEESSIKWWNFIQWQTVAGLYEDTNQWVNTDKFLSFQYDNQSSSFCWPVHASRQLFSEWHYRLPPDTHQQMDITSITFHDPQILRHSFIILTIYEMFLRGCFWVGPNWEKVSQIWQYKQDPIDQCPMLINTDQNPGIYPKYIWIDIWHWLALIWSPV